MIPQLDLLNIHIAAVEGNLKHFRKKYDMALQGDNTIEKALLQDIIISEANHLCKLITERSLLLMTEPTTEEALDLMAIPYAIQDGMIFITE